MLNIWGVMLFIRLSWIVGQAGIGTFPPPPSFCVVRVRVSSALGVCFKPVEVAERPSDLWERAGVARGSPEVSVLTPSCKLRGETTCPPGG